jgi:hypothetical protein
LQIYDKPIRLLLKDMAEELVPQAGQSFTKRQALKWFKQNFERIKPGSVLAHLIRLSTNAPARLHYNAKPIEDDVFFKLDGSNFRLYDQIQDPPPIHQPTPRAEGEPAIDEEVEEECSTEFAYESDLRNYLAKNLSIIEPGLTLYQDDEITGIEYPVGGRFVDILAVDAKGGLVVIELKVSRGYNRVVGQLMRYIAWIRKNQAEPEQDVRGVIIARAISEDLLLACSLLPGIRLFEYELSMKLNSVSVPEPAGHTSS